MSVMDSLKIFCALRNFYCSSTNVFVLYISGYTMREYKIPQIPFAFEFECNWPKGNSATICHQNCHLSHLEKVGEQPNGNSVTICRQITVWHIFANLMNANLVTNSHRIAIQLITLKLKRKRYLNYSECTTMPKIGKLLCINGFHDNFEQLIKISHVQRP